MEKQTIEKFLTALHAVEVDARDFYKRAKNSRESFWSWTVANDAKKLRESIGYLYQIGESKNE